MKESRITLLDGEHVLREPGLGARALIKRNLLAEGVDVNADFEDPMALLCMMAGLLTASEPIVAGHHKHVWTWEEVDALLPVGDDDALAAIYNGMASVLTDEDDDADPPTPGKKNAAKQ